MTRERWLSFFFLLLLFSLHAWFIGQLSPFPLFWGLLLLSFLGLGYAVLEEVRRWPRLGWLLGPVLIVFLVKFLFFPDAPWSVGWLQQVMQGFSELYRGGAAIYQSQAMAVAAGGSHSASAALFVALAVLLWFPLQLSLKGAFRTCSWVWPVVLTFVLLLWLEPLPSFFAFFLPEVILSMAFALYMAALKRKQRWQEERYQYETNDPSRSFRRSLWVLIPLAVVLLSLVSLDLPVSTVSWPVIPPFLNNPNAGTSVAPSGEGGNAEPVTASAPVGILPNSPHRLPWSLLLSWIFGLLLLILLVYLGWRLWRKRETAGPHPAGPRAGLSRRNRLRIIAGLAGFAILAFLLLWLLPPYLAPWIPKLYIMAVGAAVVQTPTVASGTPAALLPTAGTPTVPASSNASPDPMLEAVKQVWHFLSTNVLWLTFAFACVLVFLILRWWQRRKGRPLPAWVRYRARAGGNEGRSGKTSGHAASAYFRFLDLLARHGLRRQASETPWEFARRIVGQRREIQEEAEGITDGFVQTRYGSRELPLERTQKIEAELRSADDKLKRTDSSQHRPSGM